MSGPAFPLRFTDTAPSREGQYEAGRPLVSVLIPAYNAEAFLDQAVASARAQTHTHIEILVIDDASEDGTRALAEALAREDARIRVLHLPANRGPSAARNAGLCAARGEWIAILDADDSYAPERLALLLDLATAHGADMVADNLLLYDAVAGRIERSALDPARIGPAEVIGVHRFVANCIPKRTPFNLAKLKPIMRRATIESTRLRYPEDMRYGEDFIFYMRLLLAGAVLVLTNRALYRYTQPLGSLSGEVSGMSRTRHDFEPFHRHNAALLADARVRADAELLALVRQHNRAILARAAHFPAEQTLAHLRRARAYGQILRICARNPDTARLVFAKLVGRACRPVRRALAYHPHTPAERPGTNGK